VGFLEDETESYQARWVLCVGVWMDCWWCCCLIVNEVEERKEER
jgi:hypothetical protein